MLKKFIASQITILLLLSGVWLAGIDHVLISNNDDQENLHKYLQVQRRVIDNYFGDTELDQMLHHSIKAMVEAMDDSTLVVENTPIDTAAANFDVSQLRDSYQKFEDAYLYVANNHTDQDMDKLTEAAIRGLLSRLDPHSVYIEPDDSEDIQESFAGKFQGIGIQFNIIQDTITVVTAISGGPSDQLGIMSGDRIIEINDSAAVGFDNEDVVRRLRGEKGTTVNVTIQRPKIDNPIKFKITRDDIPLTTIDTAYMLDDETGYIKVNRFAATTHEEFISSVDKLESDGMKRLMLDLRNNPGGYLSQAIAISEEFFPRNTLLVSTESKHNRFNSEVKSRRNGSLKDMPVIVLVNEGSASASEIVSGAIQDHDRGLVVGRRTFGKGLVQQQYELIDNSNLRVTISRYLTPSGRLIQKPFIEGGEEYAFELTSQKSNSSTHKGELIGNVPDSLKFTTMAGRPVYGGGGILPDFVVQEDTTISGYLFNFMIANRVDFDFVRDFLDKKGETFRDEWESDFSRFREKFELSSNELNQLEKKLKEAGMEFKDVDEPEIEDNNLIISRDMYDDLVWLNKGRIKAEIARQVWGMEYFYPVINDYFNDTMRRAMDLWDEVSKLESLAVNN